MDIKKFAQQLLKKATDKGCTAAQVDYSNGDRFSVSVMDAAIDKYEVSTDNTLTLRVIYGGHDGFASTSDFDNPDDIVDAAIDNAKVSDTQDDHPMAGYSEYEDIKAERSHISDMSERECIDLCLDMEKKALSRDERVKRVMQCVVAKTKSSAFMCNTQGLDVHRDSEFAYTVIALVMQEGEDMQMGAAYRFGKDAGDIDGLIDEAVTECAKKFGAKPVPVGEYRVLFTNKCFADMLDMFQSVFSADAAQRGLSQLAGKEHTQIANECVTLCENPFMPKMPIVCDSEGVPTQKKTIIGGGELKTLIHSLKTAKKENTQTTGNGTSSGSCAFTNLYLEKGEKSFAELVQGERVLVISEVDGAGAGVNTVSGEFSLSAKGQLYENGKCVSAVNQITVAGTFFELLKNITAVGDDTEFIFSSSGATGLVGSPCVLVDKLDVAG